MANDLGRRDFLKQVMAVGSAAPIVRLKPDTTAAAAQPDTTEAVGPHATDTAAQAAASAAPADNAREGYTFLTAPEAAFVEAAVDVLVPADELTPSGTDLGIAVFIDRQLAGAWGKGDRLYQQGPWHQGPPGLGYQLPLTPAEFFRAGIATVNRYCVKTYAKEFDRLTAADRQRVLEGLDRSSIAATERISGKQFFEVLYQATMEGMFADPVYGGNRNKGAWKMIGYPGVIAVHATNIATYRNKKYLVEPVSIADIE